MESDSDGSEEAAPFRFEDLPETLKKNVERQGWTAPMPVQERVIPILLDGKDVMVQSRTGSGKTAAFTLPMCMQTDVRRDEVQGLVLVPTRELAEQVYTVVRDLIRDTQRRSVAVYGGVGYGTQIEAFKQNVHIIVATPGRMIDHLMSRRVSLSKLRLLVLDEADEMLSMGFYQAIVRIRSFLPKKVQTALFSATIPPGVASLAQRFTHKPESISLSGTTLHVEEVEHIYYVVDAMDKDRALLKIIEMENPGAALIFCNTKREVEYLGVFMKNFGYDGAYISGDLSQAERKKVMTRIRKGQLRFLAATDVAARGIDISDLGYVILYNLPQAHDNYIHRAGRTGRAGETGIAISLVTWIEEIELKKRAKRFGLQLIKREVPTDQEVETRVAERLRVMLEEKHRSLSNLEKERLKRFLPLSRTLPETGETVAMLLDRFYQETLHKPLYLHEEAHQKPRAEEAVKKSKAKKQGGQRPRRRRRK